MFVKKPQKQNGNPLFFKKKKKKKEREVMKKGW